MQFFDMLKEIEREGISQYHLDLSRSSHEEIMGLYQ